MRCLNVGLRHLVKHPLFGLYNTERWAEVGTLRAASWSVLLRSPDKAFKLLMRLCRADAHSTPSSAADARDAMVTWCLARALARPGMSADAMLHGPATKAVTLAGPAAFATNCMAAREGLISQARGFEL